MRRTPFVLIALVGLGICSPASAAPITVSFPGVTTTVDDPSGVLGPDVRVGAPFTVSYTLDPEAAVLVAPCSALSLFCRYEAAPEATFLELIAIGESTFSGPAVVTIFDRDPGSNSNDLWSAIVHTSDLYLEVTFLDPTDRRVSDTGFFVNETLDGWVGAILWLNYTDPITRQPGIARGVLIPEPTTGALVLLGVLVGLAGQVLPRKPQRPHLSGRGFAGG